jgi:hypothetical protein
MPKHALRAFFRRALIIAPLTLAAGCDPFGGGCPVISTYTKGVPVDAGLPDALDVDACNELCHSLNSFVQVRACSVAGPPDGGAQPISCTIAQPCEGRRPAGFALRGSFAGGAVGRFFATVAQLEDASVHAFRHLAVELRAHGAPRSLIARAEAAAGDEERHTRATGALARRFGARPLRARVKPGPIRELTAIAEENAVEGCVRETFGALVAGWQARAAGDRVVRRAMRAIAAEEERHAELAWAVDAWATRRLGRDLREIKEQAARSLDLREPDRELVSLAGLPSASAARALYDHARSLWS